MLLCGLNEVTCVNGPSTVPGTWRAFEIFLPRVTSAGFPSSPLGSAVALTGSVASGYTLAQRVLCSKRERGGEAEGPFQFLSERTHTCGGR